MFFISIFISEYIAKRNILFFFALESKQLNNQTGGSLTRWRAYYLRESAANIGLSHQKQHKTI